MQPILIFSPQRSPRLEYVLHWLFTEQLGTPWQMTGSEEEAASAGHCISYGLLIPGAISIPNAGLLFEQGIRRQAVKSGARNGLYTLFETGEAFTFPFDLFSALFFLLSRYEEYGSTPKDKHGRYLSNQSILYKDGVLERPVADEWVCYFREMLRNQWQLDLPEKQFTFRPTYDIDIAWSYRHKGWKRALGGAFRDLLKGSIAPVVARAEVLAGRQPDPYDAYEWMQRLHERYGLRPDYFILAALKPSPFDKNIHPRHPAMQQLVRSLQQAGGIGMHPSYFTDMDEEQFIAEKNALEEATGGVIHTSRQHFIRMFLPLTYRRLLAVGIDADYSMGYGAALGFRAGTGQSFFWYDLEREASTALRVHPFCFMDATAHYELELDAVQAFDRLRQMREKLERCGSTLTTVFHNFSLGSEPEWAGWREGYERFIRGMI